MSNELSPQDELIALLKPYVEPLVKHRLKEEEKNMPLRERCGIALMLLWLNLVMKYEWVKRWIKDKNFRKNPPPFSFKKVVKPETEEFEDLEVRKTLDVIICFWMEILALSAEDRKNLSLSELDDTMLPTKLPPIFGDKSMDHLLDEACAALVIDGRDVRNVLWAIRQSHCCVEVLPETMKDYLKSTGVAVE